MELLTERDGKQVWFHELSPPYHLEAPFCGELYVCILLANDETLGVEERAAVSKQLVGSGCRYAVCAGSKCEAWHDSIDWAYLETDERFSPPAETQVMTTWHENESVDEVIYFGLTLTNYGAHDFRRYVVLSVGPRAGVRDEIERAIQAAWNDNELNGNCCERE